MQALYITKNGQKLNIRICAKVVIRSGDFIVKKSINIKLFQCPIFVFIMLALIKFWMKPDFKRKRYIRKLNFYI